MRRAILRLNPFSSASQQPERSFLRELWDVAKPAAAHIAIGMLCFCLGGLLCARSFTMEKGTFKFSTSDDHHCASRLRRTYEVRVQHLKERASQNRKAIDGILDDDKQREILDSTVSHYLVPTSHDRLFGCDVVLFNGEGKPTMIERNEFNEIRGDWIRVLSHFGVRSCVDEFRIGEDFPRFIQAQWKMR